MLASVETLQRDALQWNPTLNAYDASRNGIAQKIAGVAAGTVSATSTDAVNGSQLYALASATMMQITSLSTGLLTSTNSIATLSPSDISSIASLSTGLSGTTSAVTQLSTSVGSLSTGLTNTNSSVAALSSGISNGQIGLIRAGTSPDDAKTTATSPNDFYLQPGVGAGPVVLHNVAAGKIATNSTDAINGGQIFSLGNSLATALGGGSNFNTTTGEISAPSYRVQGSNYTNVGSAINALDSGLNALQNNMNQVAANLHTQIARNRVIASGGVASAFAMSQLRYSDRPGSQSLGIGTGFYDNQTAVAIGYGFTSEDGSWRGTASMSYTPGQNKLGVAGGITYSW